MTEKRFTTFVENGSVCLNDALKVYKRVDVHYYEYLLKCMNELNNENEQLKKEKEYWKGQCISQSNLNSIYHNELSIAQEQGYAPTSTFKFCFGDLNKHLEKYKKFYNSHFEISERYINAVEDESTDVYQDTETMEILASYEILERLNEQDKTIKELKKENENQNNILEDFMVMLNRLQAEPNNKSLQIMSKDMLQMMGKDIMGDSE